MAGQQLGNAGGVEFCMDISLRLQVFSLTGVKDKPAFRCKFSCFLRKVFCRCFLLDRRLGKCFLLDFRLLGDRFRSPLHHHRLLQQAEHTLIPHGHNRSYQNHQDQDDNLNFHNGLHNCTSGARFSPIILQKNPVCKVCTQGPLTSFS